MIDWKGLKWPVLLRVAVVTIGLAGFYSLLALSSDASERERRERRERHEHCYEYQPKRGAGCRNRYNTLVVENGVAVCRCSD